MASMFERLFGRDKKTAHQAKERLKLVLIHDRTDLNAGTLEVFESGARRGSFGSYATGDVLQVAVESGVVKYYRNTTLLFASAQAPVYPLLSAEEIRLVARRNGIEAGRGEATTVSFCNTGHWAATNWFVLSEVLGERNVKLYPESMVDWSASGLPMDNVPGRMKQLLMELKLAAQ
jgi:hypothetical protein